jgi:bifunctional N-acetylglucosamine-1-phosphate-uridyltransferase/glucosamine-1-phosphate-acetyltransferase GlmU-like protein
MDRLLIVPAAGRGSRLGTDIPKALVRVAGQPMLGHLLDSHHSFVDRVVVVAAPSAVDLFSSFVAQHSLPVDVVIQSYPTGMLDAITVASPLVASYRPRRVVVTWCDQIAISPTTVARLAQRATAPDAAALVFPTLEVDRPYIHFDRDDRGQIVSVRQRREGDAMPDRGETDMGLFDLSADAYLRQLPAFAEHAAVASGTGELNFLPFIPWLAARAAVETITGAAVMETVGINTPEELAAVEAYLAQTAPPPE